MKRIDQVLNAVCRERERQNALWDNQNGNHPFEWMSILGEEVGELCEAVNETFFQNPKNRRRGGRENIYREAVQVAAVAVAIAEEILRLEDYQHGFCCIFDNQVDTRLLKAACLSYREAHAYLGHRSGYGWHISGLKIYDKPRRIFDFTRPACERVSDCGGGCSYWCGSLRRCMRNYTVFTPPQSWMYVEELI